jgi:hypothetical protein
MHTVTLHKQLNRSWSISAEALAPLKQFQRGH